MKDNEIDKMLTEIFNEQLTPSSALLEKTKAKAAREIPMYRLIGICILLNFITFAGLILYLVYIPQNLITKVLIYSVASALCNLSIVFLLAFRDKFNNLNII